MSAPLEEIAKEFNSEFKDEESLETNLKDELPIIFTRLIFIVVFSYLFYFSIAYLVIYSSGYSWEKHVNMVLSITFVLSLVSTFIVGMRGTAASALFMASSMRLAWTGKKMEPGALNFFRSFAFGIKWDTVLFYGSITVFLSTFFIFYK